MDQMLPSPSFNIPSIGTPHHAMEEDQMINPQALAAQQQAGSSAAANLGGGPQYSFGGFTPQNLLSSQTPQNLLSSPAPGTSQHSAAAASSHTPASAQAAASAAGANVYAPCPSPAPQSPATPMSMAPPQSMDPGIVPQLQNIVSTVSLGCKLDLKKIALSARNAEYNPKRFAAVIMRIREPRTTALIFR